MHSDGTLQETCGELNPPDAEDRQKERKEEQGIRPDDLHAWIVALDERVTTMEVILLPLLQKTRRGLLQVVRAIERLDLL